MAAKQNEKVAPATEQAAPTVDTKALKSIFQFADRQRRENAANKETESALSVLARTAAEIASEAGDITTEEFSGSPIERERRAKKIVKINEALEKVRLSVHELAVA